MKTETEMYDEIDRANEAIDNGGKFNGMSYEDGIKEALEWVMGNTLDKPMDD